MFESIKINEDPIYPNTAKYKYTIRFELPTYLQTAPNALLTKAEAVSYIGFKINVKTTL